MSSFHIYNSYTRQKEVFEPLTPGHVGLYVCGPTVSGESHLGHARPYITFDILNRYLKHLGYKVRYVRNITDAGHFEEEGREAVDKVGQKALLEKLEPMELVHKYTNLFHWGMRLFNNLDPSIEPTATGHIIEQIAMIEDIIAKGYAYEVNGSVYFDVKKYAESYDYGKLSGRILEDLLETTRELDGQEEKRNKVDFALWKNAPPEHIQRWQSPWGEGFPGWHIECSAMSSKYLGDKFDIHGGGMDLQFPHHESEIAQNTIAHGHASVRYWMHNNMITINGKKMGKSYNNVIKLTELFSGNHPMLEQPYHPMVVRFYILQTHYRSTLDFSNEALQGSQKGLKRLWEAYEKINVLELPNAVFPFWVLKTLGLNYQSALTVDGEHQEFFVALELFISFIEQKEYFKNLRWAFFSVQDIVENAVKYFNEFIEGSTFLGSAIDNLQTKSMLYKFIHEPEFSERMALNAEVQYLCNACFDHMNDDLNTAKVIANLFELVTILNGIKSGDIMSDTLGVKTKDAFINTFKVFLIDILGLQSTQDSQTEHLDHVLKILIEIRKDARIRKDFATSDQIRNSLAEAGIALKDEKDGTVSYTIE